MVSGCDVREWHLQIEGSHEFVVVELGQAGQIHPEDHFALSGVSDLSMLNQRDFHAFDLRTFGIVQADVHGKGLPGHHARID